MDDPGQTGVYRQLYDVLYYQQSATCVGETVSASGKGYTYEAVDLSHVNGAIISFTFTWKKSLAVHSTNT